MSRPIQMCEDGGRWKSISTAPIDGTIIELKNNYGVAPSYSLVKRVDDRWQKANDPCSAVGDFEEHEWREYSGQIQDYADPTRGMQDDMNYWRTAVAIKHPFLAHKISFLMDVENTSEKPKSKGLFSRIFNL